MTPERGPVEGARAVLQALVHVPSVSFSSEQEEGLQACVLVAELRTACF